MSDNIKTEKVENKKNKNKIKVILVLIAAIIFALYSYVQYRGGYLETLEIGEKYVAAFRKNTKYLLAISAVNFSVIFVSIYVTNKIIKKGLKKFFEEEKREMPKLANKSIAFILALLVAIVTSRWLLNTIMIAKNATQFGGDLDPIFNLDVGFYMFQKPFLEMMIYYYITLLIGITIYTGIYYIIVFNAYFDSIDGTMLRKSTFIKQLLTNVMLIAIGIAGLVIIKAQGVVLNDFLTLNNKEKTVIKGAGLTEKIIAVWGYRILAVLIVVAVFIAIKAFNKKDSRKIMLSLLSVPAYLVVMFIVMVGYKFIYVNQNELDKQKDYIATNLKFTKTAYNININEIDVESTGTLTKEESNKYNEVIDNIPIVTSDIVLSTLKETQRNTGYYTYNTTKPSMYEKELVYISAREISNESRTYNNKTYEYTHGYGAVVTSASKVDETGNLLYLLKDFNDEKITQPRIYYGLETNNTVVINKDSKEFDYPTSSKQNTTNTYDGNGGIKEGIFDRIVLALNEKDLKLTFVGKDSSILINRNIIERAKMVMPYLMYDDEPYLVITDDGNLMWVLDAYTTSNQYPYSQSITIENNKTKQTINYIRNSVKVLINAYTGETQFYLTDKTDPIAMAYNNMYPELFNNSDEIPRDISRQFIYSKFLYNIQSEMLKMYHDISIDVLYRGDDVWDTAMYSTSTTTTAGEKLKPYYTMVKTKDSANSELGLVLPYTIYGKQSITSYLVGTTNGIENKLTMYRFSQDSNILGPLQLNNLLAQDETISKEISTLSVTGTKLIKNMVIVPIDNTLLYVVPIYQQSLNETQSTPVLKKIVVASGTKIAIGDNIHDALDNLLSSQNSVEIEVENTDTIEELINSIIKANNNLNESTKINNWEQVGKDITKLQDLVKQLEVLHEKEKAEKTTSSSNITDITKDTKQAK